ncbi:cytochrome c-type biogenesis CcmF C-terminal domain-containing protein, partial [Vibrio splendidus]|uniref:cytochrome c-type biogenesis CcmF C-terminal domain-containing protein n=1 Tax=Vibrio splendidus TaxID=29497 RepID=UPI0023EF01C4
VHKQLGLGSVSIGAPFFDMLFFWLMIPFSFLLGIGPLIRWKRDNLSKLVKPMLISGAFSLGLSALMVTLLADRFSGTAFAGWVMAFWIIFMHGFELHERATHRHTFMKGLTKLPRSHWAMMCGNIGLA